MHQPQAATSAPCDHDILQGKPGHRRCVECGHTEATDVTTPHHKTALRVFAAVAAMVDCAGKKDDILPLIEREIRQGFPLRPEITVDANYFKRCEQMTRQLDETGVA